MHSIPSIGVFVVLTVVLSLLTACTGSQQVEQRPATGTPSSGQDPVYQYLETLQSGIRKGRPYLETESDRRQFCREWTYIIHSLRLQESLVLREFGLGDGALDCDRVLNELVLHTVPSRFSNPGFAFVAADLSKRLQRAALTLKVRIDPVPVVDTVPWPLLNAKIIHVPGSARRLVLLNSEVFRLPYEVSLAIIQALTPRKARGTYAAISPDRSSILAELDAKPEILQRYNHAILRYLGFAPTQGYFLERRLDDPIGRSVYLLVNDLTRAIELFILGHEFAHQALNHRPAAKQPRDDQAREGLVVPGTPADSVVYSWAQELEADAFGFLFMIPAFADRKTSGDHDGLYTYPFIVAAPRLLFAYLAAVQRSKNLIETGAEPPSPTEADKTTAIAAIKAMFSQPTDSGGRVADTPTLMLQHSSHPPPWLRALLATLLEQNALSSYSGSMDLAPLSDAFERAHAILDDRNTQTLLDLHKRRRSRGAGRAD